jgi:hypothetical protein
MTAGEAMVHAAETWLASLSQQQRGVGWFRPDDVLTDGERLSWFYTPTDHGGLTLHQQQPAQQSLAMQLVAAGLSRAGYATVAMIMGLENVLDLVEGFAVTWGRERGRDPGLFFVRVFGDPTGGGLWGWRFAGHHVSLNYTLMGSTVLSTTPSFLGADPARVDLAAGGDLRLLGGHEDAARALLAALDEGQLARAVIHDRAISDIVSGNRPRVGAGDEMMHMQDLWRGAFSDPELVARVEEIDRRAEAGTQYGPADHRLLALPSAPIGVAATELDVPQRGLLATVIAGFDARNPADLTRSGADAADLLDGISFSWAGGLAPGDPHYFRLHGADLLIEYDNTQRDGNHVHSVLRELSRDFGLDPLRQHRAEAHR